MRTNTRRATSPVFLPFFFSRAIRLVALTTQYVDQRRQSFGTLCYRS
jgi:hypothetical protein